MGLSLAMILGGVLLYLWPQMRLVELGYRRSDLRGRYTQALQRQKALRVEAATLRQLSRIEKIATERLGLRRPRGDHLIYVPGTRQTADSRRP